MPRLPGPVQRYLHLAGLPGQPRVRNYRLRFRGRIRSGPERGWMPFEVEQHTIAARLYVGEDGLLTNFVSDDHSRASPGLASGFSRAVTR